MYCIDGRFCYLWIRGVFVVDRDSHSILSYISSLELTTNLLSMAGDAIQDIDRKEVHH